MAPLILAAVKFLAAAAASKAVESAVPKNSLVPTGEAPPMETLDLQALVGGQQQHQSQLPKQSLQLQNRLPRPY